MVIFNSIGWQGSWCVQRISGCFFETKELHWRLVTQNQTCWTSSCGSIRKMRLGCGMPLRWLGSAQICWSCLRRRSKLEGQQPVAPLSPRNCLSWSWQAQSSTHLLSLAGCSLRCSLWACWSWPLFGYCYKQLSALIWCWLPSAGSAEIPSSALASCSWL